MPDVRRARLQLVTAAVLFSTGGAAIKATSLTGGQVGSFRSGVPAVAVLLLLPAARRSIAHVSIATLAVGSAYAATLVLFVQANKLTTSANAIFLQSTAPIYLVMLGPWLLHERNRARDFLFMAVMALGLSLIFVGTEAPASTAPHVLQGNLVALASGLSWALTVGGLRWLERQHAEGPSAVAAVVTGNAIACLVCLPFALPTGATGATDWLVILYLGVVQIGLAYAFVTAALRHIPALEASLLLLVEPVLNPVWAWLVHGERPGHWALVGGAVILAVTAVKARCD